MCQCKNKWYFSLVILKNGEVTCNLHILPLPMPTNQFTDINVSNAFNQCILLENNSYLKNIFGVIRVAQKSAENVTKI